jgi:hypothetical protein
MSNLRQAALALAQRGRHVFPLHTVHGGRCSCGCADPSCKTRGKHPLHVGVQHAVTDAALIGEWWTEDPDANIGLAPGPSNLIAFDIDHARAEDAAEAIGLFREPTLAVRTCRPDYPGAMHLYFRRPPFWVGNLTIGGALTVRCDAGHTVLPPSMHYSGRRYSVLTRADPLPLPSEALTALQSSQVTQGQPSRRARAIATAPAIPSGERHETLKTATASLAARCAGRMDRDELLGWVLALNDSRCSPPLADQEVADMVDWVVSREAKKPSLDARIAEGCDRAGGYLK